MTYTKRELSEIRNLERQGYSKEFITKWILLRRFETLTIL